ncbi:hypothetical protein ZIOFF_012532 [Zingiber officinale]|uniref:Uncharacterized protein n=1 Tax=Zingiber officinale TaxID=94328 RepID=A0A8J5IA16_ZINOF|nr:hypothetical protein ZIOFF_012532 [Zingiber officinale]
MQKSFKFLIERQPWELNDVRVPHLTHFHPHDDADITASQLRLSTFPRSNLRITIWGIVTSYCSTKCKKSFKFLIERQSWESNDVGVPHPTHFHPQYNVGIVRLATPPLCLPPPQPRRLRGRHQERGEYTVSTDQAC